MIYRNKIVGKYIKLRYVTEEDAEYVVGLRTNDNYNKYLHTTSCDITLQRQWIRNQQNREGDYYFIILNEFDNPIGLISLYDINKSTALCGRWISEGNAFENLESAKLIHDFGFETLSLDYIYVSIVPENIKVVNFWKRFGSKFDGYISSEPYTLYKYIVDKEMYQNEIKEKINSLLNK